MIRKEVHTRSAFAHEMAMVYFNKLKQIERNGNILQSGYVAIPKNDKGGRYFINPPKSRKRGYLDKLMQAKRINDYYNNEFLQQLNQKP